MHKDGAAVAGNSPVQGRTGPRSIPGSTLDEIASHLRPHVIPGAPHRDTRLAAQFDRLDRPVVPAAFASDQVKEQTAGLTGTLRRVVARAKRPIARPA